MAEQGLEQNFKQLKLHNGIPHQSVRFSGSKSPYRWLSAIVFDLLVLECNWVDDSLHASNRPKFSNDDATSFG